jgi:hypothetical protein
MLSNINALPNQHLSTLNSRDDATNNFLTAAITNPFVGLLPTPNLSPTQTQFGTGVGSSNQANYPRRLQFELKHIF